MINHGIAMAVTPLCKILVFGFVGFVFTPHIPLIAGMIAAVTLGSWCGTRLSGRISEPRFRNAFKALITLLSIRMMINVFYP